jgi:hypothetical protein
LNCGIGSSSLNAEVNDFDRLQIVRDRNSSYFGSKERQVLHDYFAWAITTTMSRYHQSADDVPNGLSIPHWSWDGLQK